VNTIPVTTMIVAKIALIMALRKPLEKPI
jgi:hypothetical protein